MKRFPKFFSCPRRGRCHVIREWLISCDSSRIKIRTGILTVWMPTISTALSKAIEHCVTIMAIWAIWMPNRSTSGQHDREEMEMALIKVQDDSSRLFSRDSRPYHSKRRQDPDSAWNLHLFAIQTSAQRGGKCSGSSSRRQRRRRKGKWMEFFITSQSRWVLLASSIKSY